MPKPRNRIDASLYQKLWEIQQGYSQVEGALEAFGVDPLFVQSELRRFSALWEEACAATTSYLLAILEQFETEQAGRLSRGRLQRERRDD